SKLPAGASWPTRLPKSSLYAFAPKLRAFVLPFQIIHPQAQPQRHVLALRKHQVDAIGRCRKVSQDLNQAACRDFSFHLPSAAPGDAPTSQAPVMQYLAVGTIQGACRLDMDDLDGPIALGQSKCPAPCLRCVAGQGQ